MLFMNSMFMNIPNIKYTDNSLRTIASWANAAYLESQGVDDVEVVVGLLNESITEMVTLLMDVVWKRELSEALGGFVYPGKSLTKVFDTDKYNAVVVNPHDSSGVPIVESQLVRTDITVESLCAMPTITQRDPIAQAPTSVLATT